MKRDRCAEFNPVTVLGMEGSVMKVMRYHVKSQLKAESKEWGSSISVVPVGGGMSRRRVTRQQVPRRRRRSAGKFILLDLL